MRPPASLSGLLVSLLGLVGCRDVPPPDGRYACTPGAPGTCPTGYVCESRSGDDDFRCYREVSPTDARVDDAGPECGPASCAGCCDPGDVCRAGDSDRFCGSGGDACQDCTTTATSCASGLCQPPCQDDDHDGHGPDCLLGPDFCDDDPSNWTALGCALCTDLDLDGSRGTDCDLPEDCDDGAPGITTPCRADGCPNGFVLVPAGPFEMGCNAGEIGGLCLSDQRPRHTVTLSAYCIEETEVRVADFRACKEAGVCTSTPVHTGANEWCNYSTGPAGRENHPLNCINWEEARQYCTDWLGGDLPTEAQWEKAARGTDGRAYPWGDAPPTDCAHANIDLNGPAGSGVGCSTTTFGPGTWAVGYLASGADRSPYGLRDMIGNLWEWVLDWYQESFYESCAGGCADPVSTDSTSGSRVTRGASFRNAYPANQTTVMRNDADPDNQRDWNGFRCQRVPR